MSHFDRLSPKDRGQALRLWGRLTKAENYLVPRSANDLKAIDKSQLPSTLGGRLVFPRPVVVSAASRLAELLQSAFEPGVASHRESHSQIHHELDAHFKGTVRPAEVALDRPGAAN